MGLSWKTRLAWVTVVEFLLIPVRFFERREAAKRAHERELAQITADANARVFEAMARSNAEMVTKLAEAMVETSRPLVTWLEGFKVTEVPTAKTITEATELGWEGDEARDTLEKERLEERELLRRAFHSPMADGRMPPPIPPDFQF